MRLGVALSGGVDSSMAALILKEKGFKLKGYTLRLGHGEDEAWRKGRDAAAELGIAHQVVEAESVFKGKVLKRVVGDYAEGRTPNPCAVCNAWVKFPLLWETALKDGCHGLATGHYARIERVNGRHMLAQGLDKRKSQAYFLARLDSELLPRLRFPLGGLSKNEVKNLAARAGLKAAESRESQDACFLPPGGWDQLMAEHGRIRPGVLEDADGKVLGRHQGLHRFTIGQRRGLGVALGTPGYVTALDGARSAVRIGSAADLMSSGLTATKPHWFGPLPDKGLTVRIRYAHSGIDCEVEPYGADIKVHFTEPQRAVAPGQLAVFFHQDILVGSAWIISAIQ